MARSLPPNPKSSAESKTVQKPKPKAKPKPKPKPIKTADMVSQIEKGSCRIIQRRPLSFIPTPSTMMNLACTDTIYGGFGIGKMVNLIGDSSTGKSIFALSSFAEMAQHPKYDEYDFIYDDAEWANSFDMEKLFGPATADRVIPPAYGDDCPVFSRTVEDFHCYILDAIDRGRPFVYVLDSFDALDAEDDKKKILEMRAARTKGVDYKGTYQMAKPKKASALLRNTVDAVSETDSVLIIVSQTRDKINSMFAEQTRSGGRALKFYACHEIWLAHTGKIPFREEVIGNNVRARISKNKITGKVREVAFPIFEDYGVDDIRSIINWMDAKKYVTKEKQTISIPELNIKGTLQTLINTIEADNLESQLKELVGAAWLDLEESLKLNRKPKYL